MNKTSLSTRKKMAAVLLLATTLGLNTLIPTQAEMLDSIAVVVNKDVILQSEIQQKMRFLKASDPAASKLPQQALMQTAVDSLIMERLQVQFAKENGLQVDDNRLDAAMTKIAGNNKMNLATFKKAVESQGINYAMFREQTRRKLLIDGLRNQQVGGKVKVSEREVEDLISSQSNQLTAGERYYLQHILIATPKNASPQQTNAARQSAEQIRQRVAKGEDFAALAREFSDNNAAAQGGDLGWQAAENLPPTFTRALALMKPGQVSSVMRDAAGFHLLRLVERQTNKSPAVQDDALRQKAADYIGDRKAEEQYRAWLQNLRSKAYIDYRTPVAKPNLPLP